MSVYIFAHNGIDHATGAESAVHSQSSSWPILVIASAVIVIGLVLVVKFLAKSAAQEEIKRD